jgi:hypothetical protein
VFAFNRLLDVPSEDLPCAFESIRSTLKPGGLFYLRQYGGVDRFGEQPEDSYAPKRIFSCLSDDRLRLTASEHVDIESFTAIDIGSSDEMHFRSMVIRA